MAKKRSVVARRTGLLVGRMGAVMIDLEKSLAQVLLGTSEESIDARALRSLVAEVETLRCLNLPEKLLEYRNGRSSGRLGALMGELRIARAISLQLGCAVEFGLADAADIQFSVDGTDCLLEVRHRSSTHPWSMVFHPDPADLDSYRNGPEAWKRSALRLLVTLAELPIAIQAMIGKDLNQPLFTGVDRAKQEKACGEMADWLATHLPDAFCEGRTELCHPDGTARFNLRSIAAPPGYFTGSGSLDTWFVREGTSRQAILDKSQKAGKRLSETGAACYLIGLDIQDAFAANGYDLLTTVLGPLIELECTAESHLFRPATASSLSLIEEARQCGRGDLLDLAQLDPAKLEFEKYQDGLYFKSELRDVGGVAALYYTDEFQFVPNPFSSNNIESIYRRFPRQLTPFALPSTRD